MRTRPNLVLINSVLKKVSSVVYVTSVMVVAASVLLLLTRRKRNLLFQCALQKEFSSTVLSTSFFFTSAVLPNKAILSLAGQVAQSGGKLTLFCWAVSWGHLNVENGCFCCRVTVTSHRNICDCDRLRAILKRMQNVTRDSWIDRQFVCRRLDADRGNDFFDAGTDCQDRWCPERARSGVAVASAGKWGEDREEPTLGECRGCRKRQSGREWWKRRILRLFMQFSSVCMLGRQEGTVAGVSGAAEEGKREKCPALIV